MLDALLGMRISVPLASLVETKEEGDGSVVFVPRGVAHAFTNAGPEPAVSYVVYSPPFDGTDRVQVGEGQRKP
jgi:mannose-6-phosphate isomerase-like protein (cupin superfamily)